MSDQIDYSFEDDKVTVPNSGQVKQTGNALEYNFDHDTELQDHTDDEAEATNTANHKLGFFADAKYRGDLHRFRNFQEELSWDIIFGRKSKDEVKALSDSRQQEIQEKYGLNSFNPEETSPYAFSIGKYKFDVGGALDQVLQQVDIGQEMFHPRSIPVALLSFGTHWVQNQKITAAGAALGGAITAPVGGEGAAPGAVAGEAVSTFKTIGETWNDTREVAVFFDTASKEGASFFYQAHVENGLPLEEARNAAIAVGVVNGASEMWAQNILAAPFKGGIKMLGGGVEKKASQEAKKLIAKGLKKEAFKAGLKTFGKQFGAAEGSEIATELIQEAATIGAEIETGQLDLKDPKQKQATIDRLVQTGISTAAATLVLGGISGGMAVNNERVNVARTKLGMNETPVAEQVVTGKILTGAEAAAAEAEMNAGTDVIGNNSNGVGDNAPAGQGAGTEQSVGKTGKNPGDGKIDLPSLKPEERHVVKKHIDGLEKSVKTADKEIKAAGKEYAQLEAEGKSTKEIEKKIEQLHDNKDFAQAEIEDIKSGAKSIEDIAGDKVKVTKDEMLQARKKQIDSDISNLNQDIKDAQASLKVAKQGNKNTTKVLDRLVGLNTKLDDLRQEKAMIESGGLENNDYRLPEAPDKGQISLQRYRKQKIQELKNGITNYIRGAKEGSKQQKIETKEIHSSIENMLREAGVRINERGDFVNLLKNTQTLEDLVKNQSKIIKKVNEVIEARNKKSALKQLEKFRKLAKPLKGSKPVGKMTADIQNRVNEILNLANKKAFDTGLAAQDIIDKAAAEGRELSIDEERRLSDLQMAGGIKERSSKDINNLNRELMNLIKTGRTLREEQLQARREAREKLVADAIASAQGNKPLDENEDTPATDLGKLKVYTAKSFIKWYRTAGGAFTNNWHYRLDLAAMHDKNVVLPKLLDYFPSFKSYTENTDKYMNKTLDSFKEIFGLGKDIETTKKLEELSKPQDLFRSVDQEGRPVTFRGSKLDALTLHLWLKNPETRYLLKKNGATFKNWLGQTQVIKGVTTNYDEDLDGQYMRERGKVDEYKYPENSMEQQLDDILTKEEKALGDDMLKFLGGEYYDHVNEWVRVENGIDMTQTEFYFPRDTERGQDTEEKDISKFWGKKMVSVTAGAVHSRTLHNRPLLIDNAFKVMVNHISDMEFMMSYNDFFKNGNAVLSDLQFRRVIEGKYGKLMYRDMKKHFGEIIQRNSQGLPYIEDIMSFFRKNISSAYIGFNPRSALKQMLAFPVYSTEIPVKNFTAGLADFAKDPIGNTKFLYNNSALLRARDSNITIEMQEISKDPKFSNFLKTGSIRDHFYILTKYGDTVNTVLGGWAGYKYAKSKGMSDAQALESVERLIYRYNQTTNMEELSNMQRGGGMGKMLGMFSSDAAKQFNAAVSTMRSYQRGSISKQEFLKKMYILQIHLPVTMLLSNLVIPGKTALAATAIVGSASFLPYFGEWMNAMWVGVLNNTLSADGDDKDKEKIYLNNVGTDPMDELNKGFKEIAKISEKGWYYNNWYDAYTRLGEPFVQSLLGVPSKNTRKFAIDPALNLFGVDTEALTKHNRSKKKNDSAFADNSGDMFAKDSKKDSAFADNKSGSMFADGE